MASPENQSSPWAEISSRGKIQHWQDCFISLKSQHRYRWLQSGEQSTGCLGCLQPIYNGDSICSPLSVVSAYICIYVYITYIHTCAYITYVLKFNYFALNISIKSKTEISNEYKSFPFGWILLSLMFCFITSGFFFFNRRCSYISPYTKALSPSLLPLSAPGFHTLSTSWVLRLC